MDLQVGVNKGIITNVPEDDQHTARAVDGDIGFAVDNPGIVTLLTSDGGKTVEVVPIAVGRVTYIAHADADLSPTAVKTIDSNPIVITVEAAPIPQATHIASSETVVPQ